MCQCSTARQHYSQITSIVLLSVAGSHFYGAGGGWWGWYHVRTSLGPELCIMLVVTGGLHLTLYKILLSVNLTQSVDWCWPAPARSTTWHLPGTRHPHCSRIRATTTGHISYSGVWNMPPTIEKCEKSWHTYMKEPPPWNDIICFSKQNLLTRNGWIF